MEEEIICNRWKDLADGFFSMPGPIFPADTNDDFLFFNPDLGLKSNIQVDFKAKSG